MQIRPTRSPAGLALLCLVPLALPSAAQELPRIDPVIRVVPSGPPGALLIPEIAEPPVELSSGLTRLVHFDFGAEKPDLGGRVSCGARAGSESFGWAGGMVRSVARDVARSGAYLADFVEGEDASFLIAVSGSDTLYEVRLTLGDPDEARGPMEIHTAGGPVVTGITTRAGEAVDVSFPVRSRAGRVGFRLHAPGCHAWAAAGAVLYAPPGARLSELYPRTELRSVIPPPDSLTPVKLEAAPAVLERYCRYLLESRPVDGGFSYEGLWYQNAFPIRTLLAGARLLDRPAWHDSALVVVERFVAAQRADGGWYAHYFGRPECRHSARNDTTSGNLADLGSMTLATAIAAARSDPERRDRFLLALRRYADAIVLPAQRPDGAFPNLRYMGRTYLHPYSVATATQAASLMALGALTGEPIYLEAGERAGLWLAATVTEEGRVQLHPHDSAAVRTLPPSAFGDVFYVVEALVWVAHYASGSEARAAARAALNRYVNGAAGLRSVARHGYWWTPRSLWSDSKMGGILFPLVEQAGRSPSAPTRTSFRRALAWLADPGLSQRMGILAPPSGRTGGYGLVATGFAGIGVAALIDPGVLLLPWATEPHPFTRK